MPVCKIVANCALLDFSLPLMPHHFIWQEKVLGQFMGEPSSPCHINLLIVQPCNVPHELPQLCKLILFKSSDHENRDFAISLPISISTFRLARCDYH